MTLYSERYEETKSISNIGSIMALYGHNAVYYTYVFQKKFFLSKSRDYFPLWPHQLMCILAHITFIHGIGK